MKLCVLFYVGLNEERGYFRIKPNRNPVHCNVINAFPNNIRVSIFTGQGMPVYYGIETLIFVLKFFPIQESPMYMSKMHASCRPHSAQDSLFFHTLQHPFLLNIFDWLLTILVTSQKVRVEFIPGPDLYFKGFSFMISTFG